jgi:hypothetical protein
MEKKELQILAQKVQLEINEEEILTHSEIFKNLEKLLSNFKKIQFGKKTKSMRNINFGYLTLNDLKKLEGKFSQERVSKKLKRKILWLTMMDL